MSDSIERLYQAVIAARDLDPATSRTARLFQRGPAKMAKKLAEEAIEVVIDRIIAENPDKVEAFRGGKTGLMGFFVGAVMREMGGQANPGVVNQLLARKLG